MSLRAECDDLPSQRPAPSHQDEDKRARILDAAQLLMASHDSAVISLNDFALAMRMAPQTIRRHGAGRTVPSDRTSTPPTDRPWDRADRNAKQRHDHPTASTAT